MSDPLLKAQHYWDEAERLRTYARSARDQSTRDAFMALAESYDGLCSEFLDMALHRRPVAQPQADQATVVPKRPAAAS
jgi:hypothetical protein